MMLQTCLFLSSCQRKEKEGKEMKAKKKQRNTNKRKK